MKSPILAVPVLFLALTAGAMAADDPCTSLSNVVTRPTVTNSVCTVEPHHVLVETGYTNLTSGTGGGNAVQYPQALVRVGTDVKHLEVDLQLPSENRAGGQSGLGDIGGGLKYLIGYSAKMQYGAQLLFTAPTGDPAFTAGASETIAAFNASLALGPVFSLTSTQNFESLAAGGLHYGSYVPTLVVSASLPHATAVFAEYAAFTNANGPHSGTRSQEIVGVSHDVGSRLQLDLEGISSATTSTGKYTGIGYGVSYMF